MSEKTTSAPPSRAPLVWAGVALTIAIVVPLLTWTYAREEPMLAGIPFFYWYQFLLVIVSVVLTTIAYRLVLTHERARRAAAGLDPTPDRRDREEGSR